MFGLSPPGVALPLDLSQPGTKGLELGVQLARIDRQFNTLVLHVRELLAQLGVLDSEDQKLGSALCRVVHAVLYPA